VVNHLVEERDMEQNEVALLIKKLKDVLPQVRENAAKALGEIGDKYATSPLIDALGDDDVSVRVAVVEALRQIGDKYAVDVLIEMMGDKDNAVRSATSEALLQLGEGELANVITDVLEGKEGVVLNDKRMLKALVKALNASTPTSERAADALVNVGAAELLVVEALWGADESVRRIATDALIQIGDAAVEPLLEKLIDSHGRQRAMDILIRLGEENLARLFMDVLRGGADAIKKLVNANDVRTIAPLMGAVSPFVESKICVRAIEALGEMRAAVSVEKLTTILTRHRATYHHYCDDVESVFSAVPTALGKIGGEQALGTLFLASEDNEVAVRAKAASALGIFNDERVINKLLLLLNDEDANVCRVAADTLGYIGDSNAVELLIEALEDERFPARESVARALGNIGDARAVDALIKALESFGAVHLSAVDALVKISTAAVEPLIDALRQHPSLRMREDAIKALGRIGDKRAIEPLGEILLTDWNLHETAVQALRQLKEDEFASLLIDVIKGNQGLTLRLEQSDDNRLIGTLLRGLNASDEQIRKRIAEALGRKKDASAVEPLIALLKDYDVTVRQSAAKALGQIGDDAAIEPLIAMLREDGMARQSAADVLVTFGEAVRTPLIEILGDNNPSVRRMAKETLEQLGEGDFAALITGVLDGEEGTLTQLEGTDDERVLIPLLKTLNSTDTQLKKRAAEALGKLGNASAVKPLLTSLNDTDTTVRQSVIIALGQIGDARALESLTKALEDKHDAIRVSAVDALIQCGENAVEPLIKALRQSSAQVRQKAARALGGLKSPNALESLITALGDSEVAVRQNAVSALGEIGDTSAIVPLAEIINENYVPKMSINAVDAIRKIGGEPAVRTLIKILGHKNDSVRKRAAEALVHIGTVAVEPLIQSLESENLTARLQAIEVLSQIGDTRAIPVLQKIVRVNIVRIWNISKGKALRQAAKEAIDKISLSQL